MNNTTWVVLGQYSENNVPQLTGIFANMEQEYYPTHGTYREAVEEFTNDEMGRRFISALQQKGIEVRVYEVGKDDFGDTVNAALDLDGQEIKTFGLGQITFFLLKPEVGMLWFSKARLIGS